MHFEYEITEHIATLSETDKGYTVELNRVAFRHMAVIKITGESAGR